MFTFLYFHHIPDKIAMLGHVKIIICCCLLLSINHALASAKSLAELREDFLLAEKKIRMGQDTEYFKLADQLKDYPLYPYLQYQWLKNNLDQNEVIASFLLSYRATRYAGLLKNKWLRQMATVEVTLKAKSNIIAVPVVLSCNVIIIWLNTIPVRKKQP